MPGQNILGNCKAPIDIHGLLASIAFQIDTSPAEVANWASSGKCSVSNSYIQTFPTTLSKTFTRSQKDSKGNAVPFFTFQKTCCSKCGYALTLHDLTAGDGIDNPALAFTGYATQFFNFPDGDATNPDGSHLCQGEQPSSGSNYGPGSPDAPVTYDGMFALTFYADRNGDCLFDINVSLTGDYYLNGGGGITGIPLASLAGTHTLKFTAVVDNPSGANPPSYTYEETFVLTIA